METVESLIADGEGGPGSRFRGRGCSGRASPHAPRPEVRAPVERWHHLFDVARVAGVHSSTVSRALDPQQRKRVKEPTRRLILDAAARLGYRPDLIARGLRNGRTATVGVVAADLGNTFVTPIIHGVTGAIETAGMLPLIAETEDDPNGLPSFSTTC